MLSNPWERLGDSSPFVLVEDKPFVDKFQAKFGEDSPFHLQLKLLPEPYIGNKDANIYLLSLNPGFSERDEAIHQKSNFAEAVRKNLSHEKPEYPNYYLDPRFVDAPGAGWWRRKTRWITDQSGEKALSQRVFLVEYSPYHSKQFKPICRGGLLPSVLYSFALVQQAILDRKWIVVMRSFQKWVRHIPQLDGYKHLISLKNPQNPCLSPGNVAEFELLLKEISR